MKTTKDVMVFVACSLGVVAVVFFVVWTIWSRQQADAFPRPTDAEFIALLDGKDIVVGRQVWGIKKEDVSDFRVSTIATTPEGIYTATVSFRAIAKGLGLHVEAGLIRYKCLAKGPLNVADHQFPFVSFVPVQVVMPRLSARVIAQDGIIRHR